MNKSEIIVCLDNVRSLYNVGSIFRSLDCIGQNTIWLCGITSTPEIPPHSNSIKKTALASFASTKWKYFTDIKSALKQAKGQNLSIYIVEQGENAIELDKIKMQFPCVFVFGHETEGVNRKLFNLADALIKLPNLGNSISWNVSSTASIVLYEAYLQLKKE